MKRKKSWAAAWAACAVLVLCPGCPAQGVGDPCVPEDEYSATFSGFSASEVSTESRSFQCQSRLCLVNHFQGRVSCPYGQRSADACSLPGSDEPVKVVVPPQLLQRRADDAVYCSCRCAGPDPSARYCECPSGYSCSDVVPQLSLGHAQLPGSYCIRAGSAYAEGGIDPQRVCDPALANCEP